MRAFEIFLVIILMFNSIQVFVRKNKKLDDIGMKILIVALIYHVFFEGIRWQMYGVYVLIGVYLILFFYRLIRKRGMLIKRSKARVIIHSIILFALIITLGLLFLFPLNKMVKPNGEYNIGTFAMDLVDQGRIEIYGETKGENRKIRIQIWYPSDETSKEIVPWYYDGKEIAKSVTAFTGMPGFLLEHTAMIHSNSYKGVSLSKNESKYPVVIISHGWSGYRNLHTDFAEMLASNGYIVISVDHTYGSLAVKFEDGTVRYIDTEALPSGLDDEEFSIYANNLVKTYSLDSKLVLDYLDELNESDSILKGGIDLENIGVLGHSTGGGGMTRLTITDDRVDALIGLDPWVEPVEEDILEQGVSVPALFIRSEQWQGGKNDEYIEPLLAVSPTIVGYQLNGINHQDFSMTYMFQPISRLIGFSGSLDSKIASKIQRDMILEFFETELKGKEPSEKTFDEIFEEIVPIFFN